MRGGGEGAVHFWLIQPVGGRGGAVRFQPIQPVGGGGGGGGCTCMLTFITGRGRHSVQKGGGGGGGGGGPWSPLPPLVTPMIFIK